MSGWSPSYEVLPQRPIDNLAVATPLRIGFLLYQRCEYEWNKKLGSYITLL
jgi:hypothetical protein